MEKENMTQNHDCFISVDPGSEQSGVAIIMLNKDSSKKSELIGFNVENGLIVDKIREYYVKYNPLVVVEDIRPYKNRITGQIISTCKFIGELNWRLKNELNSSVEYIGRWQVKKWVFDKFPGICFDRITHKITYLDSYGEKNNKKRYLTKEGELRKPTFHWVDDRVVIAAMKDLWGIPTPKPGKRNIYGFSSHSWQALAVGTCYLDLFMQHQFSPNLIEFLLCHFLPFP